MFNHIRKVPYVSGDGKGGITYFIGGFSNQLGLETQIVAAMCKFLPISIHCFKFRAKLEMGGRGSADGFVCRWHFVLRDDSIGAQGATDDKCEAAAGGDHRLERGDVWDVWVHASGVPHQEWRVSVSFAAFLEWRNGKVCTTIAASSRHWGIFYGGQYEGNVMECLQLASEILRLLCL